MTEHMEDTIAAVSTPRGIGGISIVRISGGKALEVLEKVFKSSSGKAAKELSSHSINHGRLYIEDRLIDEVLVTVMKAPKTYTREDVVEINTHGGIKTAEAALEAVLKNGARIAAPGEFTKRAFLNGRIDLSQAEAVMDIINAKTELSQRAAAAKLEGALYNKIKECRNIIITLLAHIETDIDYPEHDGEKITRKQIENDTALLLAEINRLFQTADCGKIIRNGIRTVILGKPNVGKSSLLNALLKEDRAIVTDIPGTTRDVLEEAVNFNGILLNIVDTAGIRQTEDTIEKIGVEKSKRLAESADLILLMTDGSKELCAEDEELIELAGNKKCIMIVNKADLGIGIDYTQLYNKGIAENFVIEMSIKQGKGFDKLYEAVQAMFLSGLTNINTEILISGERNKQSLAAAKQSLENALQTIAGGMPEDLTTPDLMQAYTNLGEITGESLEDDLIDKIFSDFCLGK